MNVARWVVKVGGSLLDCDDVWWRLSRWLRQFDECELIFVLGGGTAVDALREQDQLAPGNPVDVHWQCVEWMRLNSQRALDELQRLQTPVVAQLLPLAALAQRVAGRCVLIDPWLFLHNDDRRHPQPLPESWDVTSDSIAARLAEFCQADGLILLKSALPADTTYAGCAATGFVDAFFPQAAAKLACVQVVNLRDDAFPRCRLNRDE